MIQSDHNLCLAIWNGTCKKQVPKRFERDAKLLNRYVFT